MLYHRHSLNEMVHRILGVPFEEKDELCPVVRRFTVNEARELFATSVRWKIEVEYLYGEGYGTLFHLTTALALRLLSARWVGIS